MENLLIALNCVVPAFIIICTGALVRNRNVVPEDTFTRISKIAFHFLLPCLLFHSIYTTDLSIALDVKLISYQVSFLLLWYAAGFVFTKFAIPDHRVRGAFLQTFFRSNIAIIGIAMAESLMGAPGVALMAMAIAVIVPIYNVLAVVTLEVCRGGKIELGPTLMSIAKNPLIWACVIGLVFLLLRIPVPASVLKGLNQIGNAGSVMTMIALGATFQFSGVRKNLKKLIAANALRLIITPAVALAGAYILGFRGNALGTVLLCTAASLATTAYPMAIARDSDHELTGQIVVTTSFFCCFTLFLWIFVLKQLGIL